MEKGLIKWSKIYPHLQHQQKVADCIPAKADMVETNLLLNSYVI